MTKLILAPGERATDEVVGQRFSPMDLRCADDKDIQAQRRIGYAKAIADVVAAGRRYFDPSQTIGEFVADLERGDVPL